MSTHAGRFGTTAGTAIDLLEPVLFAPLGSQAFALLVPPLRRATGLLRMVPAAVPVTAVAARANVEDFSTEQAPPRAEFDLGIGAGMLASGSQARNSRRP